MRVATLAFIAASMLFAVNAVPLSARDSVDRLTDAKPVRGGAESTPPPWREVGPRPAPASSFAERVTQPTPPPWKRAGSEPPATTRIGNKSASAESTPTADAPGWKADAPGWKKRTTEQASVSSQSA
ncbi:hypothetical protein C8R43DRAFT_1122133 [Mycena crocata]|nr:hypothetical protein C8R43DRAFT_1122133 [Mycena crocata]